MDKKFKRSDFIEHIFFREANGFIEMYRIGEELRFDSHNQYFLNHGVSRFCDIDSTALLDCFGVKDLDALKEDLGPDWERDAVLAWFDIKCQADGCESRVNSMMLDTYKEAFQMMCQLSGYLEDRKKAQGNDEGLEISHILTMSTAHISQQTARLMDMDAIHAGFYPADESGYLILTVGWEDYSDVMPEDLKECVKFAAGHDCDWLRLDGDAETVEGLPVYEWEE